MDNIASAKPKQAPSSTNLDMQINALGRILEEINQLTVSFQGSREEEVVTPTHSEYSNSQIGEQLSNLITRADNIRSKLESGLVIPKG